MSNAELPPCFAIQDYTNERERPEFQSRPRGRPKTRTVEHYQRLLREREEMAQWYLSANGVRASSDAKLLNAYFSASFQNRGMRTSRISTPEFKGKLKTLRNELSEARRLTAANPDKAPFNGMQSIPH